MAAESPEERFARSYVVSPSGCWLWRHSLQTSGYGQISVYGRRIVAHRFAFEQRFGPVPTGAVLDHVCHVRHCVNPEHLQAVTVKQNCENQILSRANTSGVRGVTWDRRTRRWSAAVKHNRVSHHVGRFNSIEEAASAVAAKRNELFSNNLVDRH